MENVQLLNNSLNLEYIPCKLPAKIPPVAVRDSIRRAVRSWELWQRAVRTSVSNLQNPYIMLKIIFFFLCKNNPKKEIHWFFLSFFESELKL